MSDLAIKVDNVSKNYRLPHEKTTTIKNLFTGLLHGNPFRKSYENLHALKKVDFEIKKGEFFGIVGRNGSGKSTLLKILAGIYQPTKGKVHINGRIVPFIELGVGFNGELTGRENVYLNGALLGFSRQEVDAFYDEIVEFAELEKFMDQKLKNYSSGMQVRLAFSVATRAQADILLVDEVLAVGDADFQRKCFNHFKLLKQQKKTVVFVSHDMSAIREYCDRAALIEDSQMHLLGKPDTVATAYMKLFQKRGGAESGESGAERWGDRQVVIDAVETKVEPKQMTIAVKFTAKQAVDNPVVGYLIKDAAGAGLMGSNTKIKNFKLGKLKKGQKYELIWYLPPVLNDGLFPVTVAISHSDGISQHDWWENAGLFTIVREDKTPHAINPNAELKLIKR